MRNVKVIDSDVVDFLSKYISYNKDTGIISWKVRWYKARPGDEAGWIKDGYRELCVKRMLFKGHRVAWAMVHGECPVDMQIDHINGVRDDNRICNLRLADNSQNNANVKLKSNNTSGYKGVTWSKASKKWAAQIHHKGKHIHLGLFDRKEDAAMAVMSARHLYHGEFTRHA